MRINHKLGPLKILNQHLIVYPTPANLSYAWGFGSLAGLILSSQIVTGILLAMHYVGHTEHAFQSVQHLMTDVPSGMILRYAHLMVLVYFLQLFIFIFFVEFIIQVVINPVN
jgi:ubiquinol-cytochrome c reductase cytochrome b subunit